MAERLRNISGFEILTKLSSGGMGDVLLARKKSAHGFEKLLAIKTIRGDLARRTDIRAMFLDEARLVARLDHPAITQVYDFGEEEGTLYLAMEYVAGIALNKLLIKRGAPLPPTVASRIAAEVARGLHAAHELTDSQLAELAKSSVHGSTASQSDKDVWLQDIDQWLADDPQEPLATSLAHL